MRLLKLLQRLTFLEGIKRGYPYLDNQFVLSEDKGQSRLSSHGNQIPDSRQISPWREDAEKQADDDARGRYLLEKHTLESFVEDLVERTTILSFQLSQMLSSKDGRTPPNADLTPDLDFTLERIKRKLHIPVNSDAIVRKFRLSLPGSPRAFIVYIDGLVSSNLITESILKPLTTDTLDAIHPADAPPPDKRSEAMDPKTMIYRRLVPNHQAKLIYRFEEALDGVLSGQTALFVDGQPWGMLLETKAIQNRGIQSPSAEQVVRGPKEAFTENARINTSLIRKRLRTPNLVIENLKVGKVAPLDLSLIYLKDVANPRLVEEVRRRVDMIEVDYLPDSGMIEQLIEDNPTGPWPTIMSTERPDRVVAHLIEGHVAITSGDDPFAIIVPSTFTSWFQTSEDAYVRWPYGSLLRLVRLVGLLANLYLPAFYLAVATYHQEMVPTPLLLSIAASREVVPFPLVVEILAMEFAFDLIREAGIRVPSVIGPTIGIVGALIIGQAAVQAALVSPLVVIIVSLTALGSFAIPNYSFALSMRMLHYIMIIMAAFLGIYGLALMTFLMIVSLCATRSFGIPLTSPIAPQKPASPDLFWRGPLFDMERRPAHLRPMDLIRQRVTQRPWAPPVQLRRKIAQGDQGGNRRD